MIRVFHGDDRLKIQAEVERILGKNYEVVEGESLSVGDLASVFFGTSLFTKQRQILIKDLGESPECLSQLTNYLDTTHDLILWETKLDKRTALYKELVKRRVEIREFKTAEPPEKKLVFDIFDFAWCGDSKQAVRLCEKIETTNDPYMFFGLIVSQNIKKLEFGSSKAIPVLKLMARTDLDMKTTSLDSWLLIKSLLLKIAAIKP